MFFINIWLYYVDRAFIVLYILSVQSMKPCCHNNTSYQWSPDSSQWLLRVLNKHCYYMVVTLLVKFHLIFSPKKVTEEISFAPELLVLKFSPSINVHEIQIFKYFPSKNLLNWFFQFSFKLNLKWFYGALFVFITETWDLSCLSWAFFLLLGSIFERVHHVFMLTNLCWF